MFKSLALLMALGPWILASGVRAQTVQFSHVPTVDEVIGVLRPSALPQDRLGSATSTARTIRDPATNADMTIPGTGAAPSLPPVPAPPPRPTPAPAPAAPRPASIVQPTQFAAGSAELPMAVKQMLDVLASAMLVVPDMAIVVSGHTDSSGGPTVNEPLSQRRADAARMYLLVRGVAPDRVVAIGQGDRLPLQGTSPNDAINRRLQYWPRPKVG